MNREKMQWGVIIILAMAMISLGIMIREQNLSISYLSQSVDSLSGVVRDMATLKRPATPGVQPQAQLANPASQNCIAQGGRLDIRESPLGQYGVCLFEDNRQCEEWALLRGDCPVGGRKVTGFSNDANVYCAITGHESVESDVPGQVGTCQVDGVTCSAQEYFDTHECGAAVR